MPIIRRKVYSRHYRNRENMPLWLRLLLAFVLTVAVAFGLAVVWHRRDASEKARDLYPKQIEPVSQASTPPPAPTPIAATDSSADVAALPEPETEQPAEYYDYDDTEYPGNKIFRNALAKSAPVSAIYFDDAIFFGDSITTGLPLYHIADNAAVVAMTGVTIDNILTRECIDVGGDERATLLEAAKIYGDRKKVYILIGGNSLGYNKDAFIAGYEAFFDAVRGRYPKAVIYLQAIPPVVEGYVNEFVPDLDNAKIDEYNMAIMSLAVRKRGYYLDIASVMKNKEGVLPKSASPVDGMHFGPQYYLKWYNYLKTHTLSQNR